MKSTYSHLMQSKYFNPAFNSAIFDGPVRIYFAQFHESFALKIYFHLQNHFKSDLSLAKDISKSVHSNILIMIYPTQDNFILSFDEENTQKQQMLATEEWNQDFVIGLRQPLADEQLSDFSTEFRQVLSQWIRVNQPVNNAPQTELA